MNIEDNIQHHRKYGFLKVWVSDQGDGTYMNPIIHADYSDPDIIRVKDDFYMIASSFNCAPGLPVLHSKDLVNWSIINHIISEIPIKEYDTPQHGKGVWAPSIRFHDGYYWVFLGMPDEGIYMSKTKDPFGKWDPLHLVKTTRGWIDTCPFWDDDDQVYLVNAFAKSRIGFQSVLAISKLTADGKSFEDEFRIVFDGNINHKTIEGPKLYKRNGYYYISAPAGGVENGYQVILRSKDIYGPYEDKIVLHQGNTSINGPHQGGWVELENGDFWFVHFQDKGVYGRVVHLQPMHWEEDWPVIGINQKDGIGEPVLRNVKPNVGRNYPIVVPTTSDDFDQLRLGLQWQWQANPKNQWSSLKKNGYLRLYPMHQNRKITLWETPNLLMQKFPAPSFKVNVKIDIQHLSKEDQVGLVIMGILYKGIMVRKTQKKHMESDLAMSTFQIIIIEGDGKNKSEKEILIESIKLSETIYFQICVADYAMCDFQYSTNGVDFVKVQDFKAIQGKWIGAKFGLTALNYKAESKGYVDIDWVTVETV